MLLIKSFKSLLSIPGKSKQPGIQKLPFCHSLWFLLAEISVYYRSLSGHFHISQLFLLMVTVRTMVSMAGLWPGGRRKWAGGTVPLWLVVGGGFRWACFSHWSGCTLRAGLLQIKVHFQTSNFKARCGVYVCDPST